MKKFDVEEKGYSSYGEMQAYEIYKLRLVVMRLVQIMEKYFSAETETEPDEPT